MKIEKKVDKESFELILRGIKKYEVRLNEFECNEGDTLVLLEKDPITKKLTGRKVEKTITDVKLIDIRFDYFPKEEMEEKGLLVISFE